MRQNHEIGLLEFAKKSINLILNFLENENQLQGEFSPSQATKFWVKRCSEPSSILGFKIQELIIPKEVFENKITIAGEYKYEKIIHSINRCRWSRYISPE